jgi:hypothetical protein
MADYAALIRPAGSLSWLVRHGMHRRVIKDIEDRANKDPRLTSP